MNNLSSSMFAAFLLIAVPAFAAGVHECNGNAVGVKYAPMGISWDLCSLPDGSAGQLAFFSALGETRHYVNALGAGAGYRYIVNGVCKIDHDNDRTDTALVNRADIDGNLGLTLVDYDGCTWSWSDEHIVTADVMIAADLDFTRVDEAHILSGAVGDKAGAPAYVHELGHALGLKHSNAFATMTIGETGVQTLPFVGMSPSSGGLGTELFADDVFGISTIYGFSPIYQNLYVSSQALRAGTLVDVNRDPTKGDAVHPDPLGVCPGDTVNMLVTFGSTGTTPPAQFPVYIYTTADNMDYSARTSDALAVFTASIGGRGTLTFPASFVAPPSMPIGTIQNVYVGLQAPIDDRKGYDDRTRTALRIVRKAGC